MANADSIRVLGTTRGTGKVFVLLSIPSVGEGEAVVATNAAVGGKQELPVTVVALEGDQWVLIVPVLGVVQVPTVSVVLPTGEVKRSRRVHVRPLGARLRSSFHTLLHDDLASRVRNLDEHGYTAGPRFQLVKCAPGDEYDVVLYSISYTTDQAAKLPVEVRVLERQTGGELDLHVGLAARGHKGLVPGLLWRDTTVISLRVPHDLTSYLIWARPQDPSCEQGFRCVEPFMVDDMRSYANWVGQIEADREDYDHHFRMLQDVTRSCDGLMRRDIQGFQLSPTFSLIVPLFHTPLDFFRDMLGSVLAQTYPNFQLVLVNATPQDEGLTAEVARAAQADERITVVTLEGNRGITENTNAGIRASTGDFICFFDHDDTLEPDILYWYAKAVNDNPQTDLLYCDEDKLHEGAYVGPFYKSDWDMERLCAENYVCHMLTVRRSLVEALPQLPGAEMDGSQDHNMTFLVGEQARHVEHVRRVLYHWRMHAGSTAGSGGVGQKSYALEAERRAVQGHLDRCGIAAQAVMERRRAIRCDLVYDFADHPLVSIVIPNKDMTDVLGRCLDSIKERTTWPNWEVVVVENNSEDQDTFAYYAKAQEDPRVRVVTCPTDGTFNFARLINFGAREARGDYLLFLNNDTEVVSPDWIEEMAGPLRQSDIGIVGAKLLYPDGLLQHAGVLVGGQAGPMHTSIGRRGDLPGYYEVNVLPHLASAVTGACLMVRRDVFDQLKGMDEGFAVNYNDVDFCLRARKLGYGVLQQNYAVLTHYESVTRDSNNAKHNRTMSREMQEYSKRWIDVTCRRDPYANPRTF